MADALPTGAQVQSMPYPAGGLNTRTPSHRLGTEFSPYMRNVSVDDGYIMGMSGYETLGSSNVLRWISGIFPYVKENGASTFLVTDSSITLETSDFSIWAFVSSGSNTGALLRWMQVREKMWGYNGVDAVITWNGTSKAILDGTKNTPNVPKFAQGEYWQERVWGLNTPSGKSDLNFSAISSTEGTALAPDDPRAWPSTNVLKLGQGDGEVGTSLWVKDSQLQAGKERSKYTIYGTGESSYFARKEESNGVGVVSDETVLNLDDSAHYLSQDGIYKDAERISDNLSDSDVTIINKGIVNVVGDIWETQADFANGVGYGSSATAGGLLTIRQGDFYINRSTYATTAEYPPGQYVEFTSTGIQFTQFSVRVPSDTVSPDFLGYVNSVRFPARSRNTGPEGGSCGGSADIIIANGRTRNSFRLRKNLPGPSLTFLTWSLGDSENPGANKYPTGPLFTGYDLTNSTFIIQVTTSADLDPNCAIQFFASTTTGFADIQLLPATTVQFISEISTASSITTWGTFDSARNTNGGAVDFYLRTSTSLVNIATKTWSSIIPGAVISEPTINLFYQWASTITSVSSQIISASNIDNVSISHVEGQASDLRAFSIAWKNRYWLAVSTESTGRYRLIYMKSKITNPNPNAWMPIELPIKCFAKKDDFLYGGASTMGVVYRLDYGTNFDGVAIPYIYDYPDSALGSNYFSKNILKYGLDAEQDTGLSMTIGTSIDGGALSNITRPLDGTGRVLKIIEGVTNPCKTLRVRLSHSMLDKPFKIYDFSVFYMPSQVLNPK